MSWEVQTFLLYFPLPQMSSVSTDVLSEGTKKRPALEAFPIYSVFYLNADAWRIPINFQPPTKRSQEPQMHKGIFW